jgi:hypothetical protein
VEGLFTLRHQGELAVLVKKWVIVSWVILVSLPVKADTLITMMEGSGQHGTDASVATDRAGKEVQIWSRPDNMVRVNEGSKMIFSIDRGMTYMIDDDKKTCRALKHPEAHEVESSSNDAIEIRKTGDSRRVGEWDAEGYAMTVPLGGPDTTLEVAFWVTGELTAGLDTYRANFAALTTPQTAWMAKTLELGGYPVYQESKFGQMTMWSEVLSVTEEQAPDGIYQVPSGYIGCSAD